MASIQVCQKIKHTWNSFQEGGRVSDFRLSSSLTKGIVTENEAQPE